MFVRFVACKTCTNNILYDLSWLAGPMDEGPDLDLGPPVDPDEDSDNSAIYVQGLNDNVTLDDLADFFKQCGVVKVSKSITRSSGKTLNRRAF